MKPSKNRPSPPKRRPAKVAGRASSTAVDEQHHEQHDDLRDSEPGRPSPVPRPRPDQPRDEQPAGDTAEEQGARDRGRPVVIVLAMVAVLTTLLAATLGVLLWLGASDDTMTEGQQEATIAAERFIADFATYEHGDLAEHREKIKSFSTDRFARKLDELAALDPALEEGKATSEATVHRSGLVTLSGDKAVVVVLHDQAITNVNQQQPRIDRYRAVVTLAKVDGEWKLDDLELL